MAGRSAPRGPSAATMASIIHSQENTLKPPKGFTIPKGGTDLWADIISTRPITKWNAAELVLVLNLINTMLDLKKIQRDFKDAPFLETNAQGTKILAPHHRLLDLKLKQILQLQRSLRLNSASGKFLAFTNTDRALITPKTSAKSDPEATKSNDEMRSALIGKPRLS